MAIQRPADGDRASVDKDTAVSVITQVRFKVTVCVHREGGEGWTEGQRRDSASAEFNI